MRLSHNRKECLASNDLIRFAGNKASCFKKSKLCYQEFKVQREMSSCVNVLDVTVLNNPSKYTSPFQFEITFNCLTPLKNGKQSLLSVL